MTPNPFVTGHKCLLMMGTGFEPVGPPPWTTSVLLAGTPMEVRGPTGSLRFKEDDGAVGGDLDGRRRGLLEAAGVRRVGVALGDSRASASYLPQKATTCTWTPTASRRAEWPVCAAPNYGSRARFACILPTTCSAFHGAPSSGCYCSWGHRMNVPMCSGNT